MYNKEYHTKYNLQWRKDNPNYNKKYYWKNREKELEDNKKWRDDNPDYNKRRVEYRKQYYKDNKERLYNYTINYNKTHKLEAKSRQKIYARHKRKTDLRYSLNNKMSRAIRRTLKDNKNGIHWEKLVDYRLNDLIEHLKSTMPKGCSWNDYINGKLHIDHIIPVSAYNFIKSNHVDFKRCWALSNLQLLPAKENQQKNAKLIKPFQPALAISF